MNEELKQIAIKAKELGFKARTVTTIHTEKYLLGGKNVMLNNMCFYLYLCDLQEWLRSKHKLSIEFCSESSNDFLDNSIYWSVGIYSLQTKLPVDSIENLFNTYQEALQEGIKESLKLIKNE